MSSWSPSQSQYEGLDEFAKIAGRGERLDGENVMAQLDAPEIPAVDLAATEGGARRFEPLEPLRTQEELECEMERLKSRFAPFLQKRAEPEGGSRSATSMEVFSWRQVEPGGEAEFSDAMHGGGSVGWQEVRLPHFGPPTGRALAWYRTTFIADSAMRKAGSVWVHFEGADYLARVYVNGRCVGEHEGFFAHFEFEITRDLCAGENTLFIELYNDGICKGYASESDGDKLYAATGPGWDEPGRGWHHCPPGMGLHRPVRIESRSDLFIREVWVRPLIAENTAEVRVEIFNCHATATPWRLDLEVEGQNFSSQKFQAEFAEMTPAGPGVNFYTCRVPLAEVRMWCPETPWLYRAVAMLWKDDCLCDVATSEFGMRSFRMEENEEPYGRLTLNGKPIRLRGANTMGFEQQRVAAEDREGLIHDLLLAKAANMNFLRFTQRPVEREVYELCDALGLMTQTDLPLFAYLRRTQFAEAVRQAGEMARHVRGHACNVTLTYINEPFPASWGDKTHRHLSRRELEGFFAAASHAVRVEDPDVVIKPVDGDYDPPAPTGLPDSHIYTLWYNGHGGAFGQLHKGRAISVKKGWHYGCGEYGAEGLDYADLMRRRYPESWLPNPEDEESAWTPSRIPQAQTADLSFFYFDRGGCLEDWVRRSQEHQRWATQMLTEIFRRDARLVSCAVHLFIDAWPAGWMKAIMDCERRAKPAYFALRDAFAPLLVSLRSDRWGVWSGETVGTELWICRDECGDAAATTLCWHVEEEDGRVLASGSMEYSLPHCTAECLGRIVWCAPASESRTRLVVRAAVVDGSGKVLADGLLDYHVFPKPSELSQPILFLDPPGSGDQEMANALGVEVRRARLPLRADTLAVVSGWPEDEHSVGVWLDWVANGGCLFVQALPAGEHVIAGEPVEVRKIGFSPPLFVSRATGHEWVEGFSPGDFKCWYDARTQCIEPLLSHAMVVSGAWRTVLISGNSDWGQDYRPGAAMVERPWGRGRIVLSQLDLTGKLRDNPVASLFLHRIFGDRHSAPPARREESVSDALLAQ